MASLLKVAANQQPTVNNINVNVRRLYSQHCKIKLLAFGLKLIFSDLDLYTGNFLRPFSTECFCVLSSCTD